jgi:hypothetical protein
MSQRPAIFFCDLNSKQIEEAKVWSRREGAVQRKPTLEKLSFMQNRSRTIRIDVNKIESQPAKSLDELSEDLLACACHIYQADRMMARPQGGWTRELEFHIGVHDQTLWESNAPLLSKMIYLLTKDTVRIRFYKFSGKRTAVRLPELGGQYDGGVCVFSDNLDAVAGVAIEHDSNSIVASFRYGTENPGKYYRELLKNIMDLIHPRRALDNIGFRIIPKGFKANDFTQRTKGFLHLALAAAVARGIGLSNIEQLQVFGNGISSYHLKDWQLCGPGKPVRDTHPEFLKAAQSFFQKLFPASQNFKIINQFQYLTPSDVLKQLSNQFSGTDSVRKLYEAINDCSEKEIAKKFGKAHCGCCFACKLRRLAALGVNFEKPEDHSAYATDPLVNHNLSSFKASLGSHHIKRVEDYHENGLPVFKSYIQSFHANDADILKQIFIGREIERLATETLNKSYLTVKDIQTKIIALHRQFADEAVNFF